VRDEAVLDWLVIGGGIHGTALSLRLLALGKVSRDRIRILDPHEALLARWSANTSRCGMQHLRSPHVHHLDVDPWSLPRLAEARQDETEVLFQPYNRPSLELFRSHCDGLLEELRLEEAHLRGRALSLQSTAGGIRVESDRGALEAKRILLAVSASEHPRWPPWAKALRRQGAAVVHVFDEDARMERWDAMPAVCVVGGGITAVQTARRLASQGKASVVLLARQNLRLHYFDSDPCYLGPKCMKEFLKDRNYERRRRLIRAARRPGTVPPDLAAALAKDVQEGRIAFRTGEISEAGAIPSGKVRLRIDNPPSELETDGVVLATGFESARPGGELVEQAIEAFRLPCAPCGYPVLDEHLRWHPSIHVSGGLAELELGPSARNIIGARRAGERIARNRKAEGGRRK